MINSAEWRAVADQNEGRNILSIPYLSMLTLILKSVKTVVFFTEIYTEAVLKIEMSGSS